jgi:hypothetical protein
MSDPFYLRSVRSVRGRRPARPTAWGLAALTGKLLFLALVIFAGLYLTAFLLGYALGEPLR